MRKKKEAMTGSLVGKDTEFKGVLKDREDVRVDGKFEGEIETEGTVVIGEGALVQANIKAASVDIGGKVIGDISCEGKVDIFSSGSVEGKIKAADLMIAEGAFFNGECDMAPPTSSGSQFGKRAARDGEKAEGEDSEEDE